MPVILPVKHLQSCFKMKHILVTQLELNSGKHKVNHQLPFSMMKVQKEYHDDIID